MKEHTAREALTILRKTLKRDKFIMKYGCQDLKEDCKAKANFHSNMIKLVKKQLPMRPKKKDCPCCEGFLFNWYDYCPYCGQRLEWEEE